ncbi:MAG: hypothetical protein ACLPUG_06825 [Acidimicrobiales bacterium]|jgi:hypothetical protein
MRAGLRSLVAAAALFACVVPSLPSAASTKAVPTRYLPSTGGAVHWTTTVDNAQWCDWSSSPAVTGFEATVPCKTGMVTRSARFKANMSAEAMYFTLSLTTLGKTKTVKYLK